MDELLMECKAFFKSSHQELMKQCPAMFTYDAKHTWAHKGGQLQARSPESLFLKEGQKDSLFGLVGSFLHADGKKEYEAFNIPYKLNILLHGLPGTGKTSVIRAIASHFATNLMVLPFSQNLNDETLAAAMRYAVRQECRVMAIEDVDCLFENRKADDTLRTGLTLSGLLNCLDGIPRDCAEGLVVFLTANSTNTLDPALIRTSRLDLSLQFTHADQFQTKACFDFYYPLVHGTPQGAEQEWEHDTRWTRFWDGVSHLRFTPAMLQQLFFQNRRDPHQCCNPEALRRLISASQLTDDAEKPRLYT